MAAEGARIAIYNGSSVPALAERTADYLRSQGANVVQVGNANQSYNATTIVDYSGSPYANKYLVDLIGISSGKIYSQFDPNSPVDVDLYLGEDWAYQNSLP